MEAVAALDFRALFEGAPARAVVLSPELVVLAASDAYLRATQTRRGDLVGRKLFDAFPEAHREPEAAGPNPVRASLERVLRTGQADRIDEVRYDVPLAGGGFEERHWAMTSAPLLDSEGRVAAIVHQVEDVSAVVRLRRSEAELRRGRAEAEAALARERERLVRTLETAEVATWALDLDADRVYASRILQRFFGVTDEEANGGPLAAYLRAVREEDLPTVAAAIEESIRTGAPYEIEYRVTGADGNERWVLARGHSGEARIGAPVLSGVLVDITDRKRAEEALRTSEAQMRRILNESPAFTAVMRGPDLVFEFVSEAYRQLIGHRSVLGQPVREALPEVEGQGYFEARERMLECGEPFGGREMPVALRREPGEPLSQRFIDLLYQPLREPDGAIGGVFAQGVDVTDQVLARRELAAQRQQFRALLDRVPEHIVTLRGSDLVYEFANRPFLEFLGKTWDEVIGKRVDEAWPVPPEHVAMLRGILETGEPVVGKEAPVWSPSNPSTLGYYDFGFLPIREPDGIVSGVFVYSLDVSEKVLARRGLVHSEARYRAFFEQASVGVCHTDLEGRYVLVNDRYCDIVGRSREELLGLSKPDITHPEDEPRNAALVERLLETGEGFFIEKRYVLPDGGVTWVHNYVSLLRDETGNPLTLQAVTIDINQRRQAQEALRTEREKLRSIVELAPSFVALIQGPSFEFELANEACFRLMGRHDLVGKTVAEVLPDMEEQGLGGVLRRVFETGKPTFVREARLRVRDDFGEPAERVVNFSYQPVWEPDGGIYGIVVHGVDVTDEVRARDEVERLNEDLERRVEERTRELQEAYREADGFNYTIAHDLRSPLRAIVSSSRILLEDYGDAVDADARHELVRQAAAANKMAVLIDELLKLSRLSRQEMTPAEVDLSALAGSIADDLVAREWPRPPRFAVQPGMVAWGDATLLRLLLTNLMENACKFSPNGAEVTVATAETPEGRAFVVRDRGVGFEAQYAEKVFLPFERLVRDVEFPGTGIGLANVRRIAERHGGKVWAESAPGEGAAFYFTL